MLSADLRALPSCRDRRPIQNLGAGAGPGGSMGSRSLPPPRSKEEKKKKEKEKRKKKEKNVQLYQRQTFCLSEVNRVDRVGRFHVKPL